MLFPIEYDYLFPPQYLFPDSSYKNTGKIEGLSSYDFSNELDLQNEKHNFFDNNSNIKIKSIFKDDNQNRISVVTKDQIIGQDYEFIFDLNLTQNPNFILQDKDKDIIISKLIERFGEANSLDSSQENTLLAQYSQSPQQTNVQVKDPLIQDALAPQSARARVVSPLIQYSIAPKQTDSTIDDSFGSHYAVIDPLVTPKNQLLVFLPGTGAEPAYYELFAQEAAKLGYHAIGLSYPNSQTVAQIADYKNRDSFGQIRGEILDGMDRTNLITVNRSNSIENRLIKLLTFLDSQHPEQGWGQYLNGNTPKWTSIAIAGHSQGGGEAAFIAKEHEVSRVIMFAPGLDPTGAYGFAPWVSAPHLTPSDRYYGFMHVNDPMVSFPITMKGWDTLGLSPYGGSESVDSQSSPYHGSHRLTTAFPALIPKTEHGSIVVDSRVPLLPDGTPIYQDAWRYLLDSSTPLDGMTSSTLALQA